MQDNEFRDKQSKFVNSLFLLEHGLSDIIKSEKHKYNKWRRDVEKAAQREKDKAFAFRKNMTMRGDMSKSPKKEETAESLIASVNEFDLMSVPTKRTRFT
jgi:hypothetical protein